MNVPLMATAMILASGPSISGASTIWLTVPSRCAAEDSVHWAQLMLGSSWEFQGLKINDSCRPARVVTHTVRFRHPSHVDCTFDFWSCLFSSCSQRLLILQCLRRQTLPLFNRPLFLVFFPSRKEKTALFIKQQEVCVLSLYLR